MLSWCQVASSERLVSAPISLSLDQFPDILRDETNCAAYLFRLRVAEWVRLPKLRRRSLRIAQKPAAYV
jgi:hypothetical protein